MYRGIARLLGVLLWLQLAACDSGVDPATSDRARSEAASAGTAESLPSIVSEADAGSGVSGADAGGQATEIDWDQLMPADWRPDTLMEEYNADELSDDDPRAQELMDRLREVWDKAPVVSALDGRRVRLPGFVVPLEMDQEVIDQFLLVPYYGACIHVPPPPVNQTVHVVTRPGEAYPGQLFDTVWVTGTMRVEHLSSELAEAGYRLEDARVTPYE